MSTSLPYTVPKLVPHSQRTAQDKKEAERNHTATHTLLRRLQRSDSNKGCADCTATTNGWAVLPHGIFTCINCAQVHRSLGRHISMVKAVSTGTYTWYPDEVAVMQAVGNARNAQLHSYGAPPKPEESASRHDHERYIRDKYEKQKWNICNKPHRATTSVSKTTSSSSSTTTATATDNGNTSSSSPRLNIKSSARRTKTSPKLSPKLSPSQPHKDISTRGSVDSIGNGVSTKSRPARVWGVKEEESKLNKQRRPLIAKAVSSNNSILDDQEAFEACRSALRKPIAPNSSTLTPVDFFSSYGL